MVDNRLSSFEQLLSPEALSSVAGLELISKVIVDGYLSGQHQSSRLGAGMEFSQYRSYQSGDDLRLLDWKMLARSGRYFIKEAEIETNISIRFIVDLSHSMLHKERSMSKLDYAKVLVAAMAFLSKRQGDDISLFGLNDNEMVELPARRDKQHFHRFLKQLIDMTGQGKWPDDRLQTEKLHDRRHKELIVFVTDLYENDTELMDFIHRLKTGRNEVNVLQLMGQKEIEFGYSGAVTFEDLETKARIKVDSAKARHTYLSAFDKHMGAIKRELTGKGISHELIRLNDPPANSLEIFLRRRTKLI